MKALTTNDWNAPSVSDEKLLLAMPVILEGVTFRWFKRHEIKFANWGQFKKAFRYRFGDNDFERSIRE